MPRFVYKPQEIAVEKLFKGWITDKLVQENGSDVHNPNAIIPLNRPPFAGNAYSSFMKCQTNIPSFLSLQEQVSVTSWQYATPSIWKHLSHDQTGVVIRLPYDTMKLA